MIFAKKGFILNRIECSFSGQQVIIICEILSKQAKFNKCCSINNIFSSFELDCILSQIKPFVNNRQIFFRVTLLDGLFNQTTVSSL
jgi:hypothetical protein